MDWDNMPAILHKRSYGLWVMGYGLWVMGYGLWVMGYGFGVVEQYSMQCQKILK
jgi:hypothetical protein